MPILSVSSSSAESSAVAQIAPLQVKQIIRKLRGGSQSKLVRCEDGGLYVLKCFPNPQGSNVLANEWIGSAVIAGMGISTPPAAQVQVSSDLIDSSELINFEFRDFNSPPSPGIHFATRMIGAEVGANRVQEYKPRTLFQETQNMIDYLHMRLIDLWANTQDTREFVFLRPKHSGGVRTFFVDHGHMFGGPEWDFDGTSKCEKLSKFQMLSGVGWSPGEIEGCIRVMEDRIPAVLQAALHSTPLLWYKGDPEQLERFLLTRLSRMRELSALQGLW